MPSPDPRQSESQGTDHRAAICLLREGRPDQRRCDVYSETRNPGRHDRAPRISGICPVGAGLEHLSGLVSRYASGRKSRRPAGFRRDWSGFRPDWSDRRDPRAGPAPPDALDMPEYDIEGGANAEMPLGICREPPGPGRTISEARDQKGRPSSRWRPTLAERALVSAMSGA